MDKDALKGMIEDIEVKTSGLRACDIQVTVAFARHLKTASKIAAIHAIVAEVMGQAESDSVLQSVRTEGSTVFFARHNNVSPQDARDLVARVVNDFVVERVVYFGPGPSPGARNARVVVRGSVARVEVAEHRGTLWDGEMQWSADVTDGFRVGVLEAAVVHLSRTPVVHFPKTEDESVRKQ